MSALSPSIAERLEHQLNAGVVLIVNGVSLAALKARPPSGKWSAHENLAHLVQHYRATIARFHCIVSEDRPQLPSYRSENDPDWPKVSAAETAAVLTELKSCHAELKEFLESLSPQQLRRTGVHPAFGELNLEQWLEFFLLHEAHHLYVAFTRARGRE